MNKHAFRILILSVVLLVGCNQTSPATPTDLPSSQGEIAQGSWQIINEFEVNHPTTLAGILEGGFGLTAGPGGDIRYTNDGGVTWTEADNDSLCRYGLEIVSRELAWHCGNGGQIGRSIDGWKTWQAVTEFGSNEPRHCRLLSFLDDETGWAATPYELGATNDGGKTWLDVKLPDDRGKIVAIDLASNGVGYLLDSSFNLLTTKDGGETWGTQSLNPPDGGKLIDHSAPMAAMRWLNSSTGIILINLYGDGESLVLSYSTTDGGQTWQKEVIPVQIGALFLTRDAKTLTITHPGNSITVLTSASIY